MPIFLSVLLAVSPLASTAAFAGESEHTTYTVTFDSNGGSDVSAINNVAENATVTLPEAPTKDGFTFDGWFTDNGTFENAFTADTAVTENITVYAKWNAAYTLTIGTESEGGVGYTRTITVGGTKSANLENKYLVTAITEGSGDNAKVSVVMFALTGTTASVSYETKGATVETWIVSANSMPKFTADGIDCTFDAHDTTAD